MFAQDRGRTRSSSVPTCSKRHARRKRKRQSTVRREINPREGRRLSYSIFEVNVRGSRRRTRTLLEGEEGKVQRRPVCMWIYGERERPRERIRAMIAAAVPGCLLSRCISARWPFVRVTKDLILTRLEREDVVRDTRHDDGTIGRAIVFPHSTDKNLDDTRSPTCLAKLSRDGKDPFVRMHNANGTLN